MAQAPYCSLMARSTPWKDQYTLLCEKCGYVVEGLDQAGVCPECGKPIEESLPQRRVGTPWQQQPGFKSLIKTWWMTLRHPKRTLDVMRFDDMLPLTPLSATLFYTIVICIAVVLIEPIPNLFSFVFAFGIMVFLGIAIWFVFFALSGVEAFGLQFFGTRRGGRVDPNIAWAIVGHGAVGWALTGFTWVAGWKLYRLIYYLNPTTDDYELRQLVGRYTKLVIEPSIIGGLVIGFLFFELFAYLGVRRCKYANRLRPQEPLPNELRP